MGTCNDPKCPLNRQGVLHEDHDSIENKPVQNPCNDPRCAMNRMGMKHEAHDGKKSHDDNQYDIPHEKSQQKEKDMRDFHAKVESDLREKQKQFNNDTEDDVDSFDDAMQELGRRINRDSPNRISREKIQEERRKRERQSIEQEAQEEVKRRENLKKQENVSTKSKIFSRSSSGLPSINQILHSSDHYETFNISQDTTCDEIKSKYKELSKNYNAARGSVNRSDEEQERLNKTQSKINIAYDFLRKKHCG